MCGSAFHSGTLGFRSSLFDVLLETIVSLLLLLATALKICMQHGKASSMPWSSELAPETGLEWLEENILVLPISQSRASASGCASRCGEGERGYMVLCLAIRCTSLRELLHDAVTISRALAGRRRKLCFSWLSGRGARPDGCKFSQLPLAGVFSHAYECTHHVCTLHVFDILANFVLGSQIR